MLRAGVNAPPSALGMLRALPTAPSKLRPHLPPCALGKCKHFSPPAYLIRSLGGLVEKKTGESEKAPRPRPKLSHNLLEPRTSRALTAAAAALGPRGPASSMPCPPPSTNPRTDCASAARLGFGTRHAHRVVLLPPAKSAPGISVCKGAWAGEAYVPPVYEWPWRGSWGLEESLLPGGRIK